MHYALAETRAEARQLFTRYLYADEFTRKGLRDARRICLSLRKAEVGFRRHPYFGIYLADVGVNFVLYQAPSWTREDYLAYRARQALNRQEAELDREIAEAQQLNES